MSRSNRAIHRQTAAGKGASRTDAGPPSVETGLMKKRMLIAALVLAAFAPRALPRRLWDRGRVMVPMAVALPLALLRIVSLAATLRWMALSSG
jgi:hypothetical protein